MVQSIFAPASRKQEMMLEAAEKAQITVIGGSAGCLPAGTEVLTQDGWKLIEDCDKQNIIAQYDTELNTVLYLPVHDYIKAPCEQFYKLGDARFSMTLSPEHTVLYKDCLEGNFKTTACKDIISQRGWKGFIKSSVQEDEYELIDTYVSPIEEVKSVDGYKYCFTTLTGFFVVRQDDQIFITGNSGKSYILQLIPLMLIDDPKTTCIMFRRTTPMISGQGGIWDTACGIYNQLPKKLRPKIRLKDLSFVFPNGARVKYQHMERVNDKLNIQGLQFTFIGVDEACQFEWEQLEYMMSRLRSESHHRSRMVMSCNPDPDHELRRLLDWYLDEDGYPIKERDGVIRWFIRRDGEFIWGDTQEELKEKYGEKCLPLSFTFVSANVYDNPIVEQTNPEYVAFLEGLNEVDKAQLLHGCWDARAKGSNYFQRDWVLGKNGKHNTLPASASHPARGYDLAAQERSQVNKYPDFTTGVKVYKYDGIYYIVGDYYNGFYDEETNCHGRLCCRVGERNLKIAQQAERDGKDCTLVFPVDPGAAGKQVYTDMASKFGGLGYRVKKDVIPTNKDKLTKFIPFADAAENGLVKIVEDSFDPVTLEIYLKELESFDNTRSSTTRKDDFVDATATAFNYLSQGMNYEPFHTPNGLTNRSTPLSSFKHNVGSFNKNKSAKSPLIGVNPFRHR